MLKKTKNAIFQDFVLSQLWTVIVPQPIVVELKLSFESLDQALSRMMTRLLEKKPLGSKIQRYVQPVNKFDAKPL